MTVTYGFFNSDNGDRKYNAKQMSDLFIGIIRDGVFRTVGDCFAVKHSEGMIVNVGTGRGWFNGTWIDNSALYPFDIPPGEQAFSRIDAIVIETNHEDAVRATQILHVRGTAAAVPQKPEMYVDDNRKQYALAYITVPVNATSITNAEIEIVVGHEETPFVKSPMEDADVSFLWEQWEAQFIGWFEHVQTQFEGDVAWNLQNQITKNYNLIMDRVSYNELISTNIKLSNALAELYNLTDQHSLDDALLKSFIGPGNIMFVFDFLDPITKTIPPPGTLFEVVIGAEVKYRYTTKLNEASTYAILPIQSSPGVIAKYRLQFPDKTKFPVGYTNKTIDLINPTEQASTKISIFKVIPYTESTSTSEFMIYDTTFANYFVAPYLTEGIKNALFCLIGAGAGGGGGGFRSNGGGGGSSGAVSNFTKTKFSKISMIIGAGGFGGDSSSWNDIAGGDGGPGGATSLIIDGVSVGSSVGGLGGIGGRGDNHPSGPLAGAGGSGSGGRGAGGNGGGDGRSAKYGSKGDVATGLVFNNNAVTFIKIGGGGGGGENASSTGGDGGGGLYEGSGLGATADRLAGGNGKNGTGGGTASSYGASGGGGSPGGGGAGGKGTGGDASGYGGGAGGNGYGFGPGGTGGSPGGRGANGPGGPGGGGFPGGGGGGGGGSYSLVASASGAAGGNGGIFLMIRDL